MPPVLLQDVSKVLPGGRAALSGVSLEIGDGEFWGIIGPSGCGKTTLLRLVAGLDVPTSGTVMIGPDEASHRPRGGVALVVQGGALYPHLTAEDNIAFGPRIRRRPAAEVAGTVAALASAFGLRGVLQRKPRTLSRGHQQEVAMARAAAGEAQLLLLDEPLSDLDPPMRQRVKAVLVQQQRRHRATTLYATNDQSELFPVAERIAVLDAGAVQQVDTPAALYDRPANTFVAAFVGSPPMNLLQGYLELAGQRGWVRLGSQRLWVEALPPAVRAYEGREVIVGIRPQHIGGQNLAALPADQRLEGRVSSIERLGWTTMVHLLTDTPAVAANQTTATVVAQVSARERLQRGVTLSLPVDSARLHWFDPATGYALTG